MSLLKIISKCSCSESSYEFYCILMQEYMNEITILSDIPHWRDLQEDETSEIEMLLITCSLQFIW